MSATHTLPWGEELPEVLIHVTAADALPRIVQFGLPKGAQWANADVAAYHARLLEDIGYAPAILSLPRQTLLQYKPTPDWEALNTPPLEVVRRDTMALNLIWTSGDPTPDRSLGLVGSLRTEQLIPAALLHSYLPHLREQAARSRTRRRQTAQQHRKKHGR